MGEEGWRGLVAGQVDAQASPQYGYLSSNDKRMRQGMESWQRLQEPRRGVNYGALLGEWDVSIESRSFQAARRPQIVPRE